MSYYLRSKKGCACIVALRNFMVTIPQQNKGKRVCTWLGRLLLKRFPCPCLKTTTPNSPCRSAPVSFTPSLDVGTDVPVKSSCWIEKSGVEAGVGGVGADKVALQHTTMLRGGMDEDGHWTKHLHMATGGGLFQKCW